MISLTYVSRSLVEADDRDRVLEDIRVQSIARNTALDITGLLIASPAHFAQLIEGEQASVDAVIDSIVADKRHEHVHIITREQIEYRRCPFWRMLSFEATYFVNTSITPLMAALYTETDNASLRKLDWLIYHVIMDEVIARLKTDNL